MTTNRQYAKQILISIILKGYQQILSQEESDKLFTTLHRMSVDDLGNLHKVIKKREEVSHA